MNPLIFVVYLHNGVESPALHYEDRLPPKHNRVVYQLRIDKQPNAEALEAMTLAELYQRYRAERDRAAQR